LGRGMIRELMAFRRVKANILPSVIHDLKVGQILRQDGNNGKYRKKIFMSINFAF
jgi:hypothetical protein